MLNNVPTQINRSARLVTLRHPNAMDCSVWRKKYNRTADATLGGLPNIGGMGLLDGEDEADFEWELLGDAKILFAGIYQGEGANWNDADTGIIYATPPQEAMIECVLDPSDPGYFVAGKPDRITVEPGLGMILHYEILGENSPVNIPPYNRRYIVAARQDQFVGIG